MRSFSFTEIATFYTDEREIPRHWSISNSTGKIVVFDKYKKGIEDIKVNDKIMVIFVFHKSPLFKDENIKTTPPHKNREMGVFSICSPVRPNPIGVSVLQVTGIEDAVIHVKNIDMVNDTPILDIKPYISPKK